MELKTMVHYVESHVTLMEDVDFSQEHLEPDMLTGGRLFHLSKAVLVESAKAHGFDEYSWSGFYNGETRTVDAIMRTRVTDTVSGFSMEERVKLANEVASCSHKYQNVQHHRRRITVNGISFGGKQFQNPNMLNHLLEEVELIPLSEQEIKVLTSSGELIFKAHPSPL